MDNSELIIVISFLLCFSTPIFSAENNIQIAEESAVFLVPFYPDRLNKTLADKFSSQFREQISKGKFFTPALNKEVERQVIDRVLGEKVEKLKTWRYSDKLLNFLEKVDVKYALGGKISRSGGYLLLEVRLLEVKTRQKIIKRIYFYESYQNLYQQGAQDFLNDIHNLYNKEKNRFWELSILGGKSYGEQKEFLFAGGEIVYSRPYGEFGLEVGTIADNPPSQYFLNYRSPDWKGLYFLLGINYFNFRGKNFSLRDFNNIKNSNDITFMEYIAGARAGMGVKINFKNFSLKPEFIVDGIYAKWNSINDKEEGLIYTLTPKISIGYKIHY